MNETRTHPKPRLFFLTLLETSPIQSHRKPAFVVVLLFFLMGCSEQNSTSQPSNTQEKQAAEPVGQTTQDLVETTPAIQHSGSLTSSRIRLTELSANQFPEVIPDNGARHEFATILESLGSGVAAIDLDSDHWPDVLVAGGGDLPKRKFVGHSVFALRNRQSEFHNVTDAAGLSKTATYHHALSAHDFNNDGFTDVLVTGYGAVQLFENLGDGTFVDVTGASGLNCPTWTASAAWGDFNQDGHPDVYLTGYVDWSWENDPPCYSQDGRRDNCSPRLFEAVPDFLYYGNGDGTFRDVTEEMNIKPDGKSLGVVCADIDQDSDIDIYVGNDVMENYVYRNQDGDHFEDWSVASGASVSQRGSPDASMGVAVADYNMDGKFDVWAANFEMESFALYHNHGSMMFRHISESTGVTAIGGQYVGWGSVFEDLDQDGDPDLAVCNGHVVMYPEHSPAQQRMVVLENIEGTRFAEVTDQVGEAVMRPLNGRGLAATDWNRDGKIDLVTSPIHSPARMLTNECDRNNRWITLKLIGTDSQTTRQPVGGIVHLKTDRRTYVRQLVGGGSYASTNWDELHFALPDGEEPITLTVRWPANREGTNIPGESIPWNQPLTLVQGHSLVSCRESSSD